MGYRNRHQHRHCHRYRHLSGSVWATLSVSALVSISASVSTSASSSISHPIDIGIGIVIDIGTLASISASVPVSVRIGFVTYRHRRRHRVLPRQSTRCRAQNHRWHRHQQIHNSTYCTTNNFPTVVPPFLYPPPSPSPPEDAPFLEHRNPSNPPLVVAR